MTSRTPVLGTLIVLACTACADRPSARADGAPAAPETRAGFVTHVDPGGIPIVTVTAHEFSYDAPNQLPAGPTTFRLVNAGNQLHHMQLVRFAPGKTLNDYMAALKAGGPPPGWATEIGGPNAPDPHSEATATVNLEPGDYGIICFVDLPGHVPHFAKGMIHPLHVIAAPAGAAPVEPTPDVKLTLEDYNFRLSAPMTAGHQVIRVDNTGPQVHEVQMFRLLPGKTMEDMQRFLESGLEGTPPAQAIGGVAGLAPTRHSTFDVDLTPGSYVLACFIPDSKDGKRHIAHGMVMPVQVT